MRLCLRLPSFLALPWCRRSSMAATGEAPPAAAAAGATGEAPASVGAPPVASLPHEGAPAPAPSPSPSPAPSPAPSPGAQPVPSPASAPEPSPPAPLLLLAPPPPPPLSSPEAPVAVAAAEREARERVARADSSGSCGGIGGSAASPLQALPFELLEHLVRRLPRDDRSCLHMTCSALSAAVAAAGVEKLSIELYDHEEGEEDPAALLHLASRLAARFPRLSDAQLPLASAWPALVAAAGGGGGGGGALRALLGRLSRVSFGCVGSAVDEAAKQARAETIAPLLASGLLHAVADIHDLGPRCSGVVLAAVPSGGLRSLRALQITSFPGATPAAVAGLSALTSLVISPEEAPAFDAPTAAALAGLPSLRRLVLDRVRGAQYTKWLAALPEAKHLTELLVSGGWGASEPIHIDLSSAIAGCAASLVRLRLWGFDVASGIDAEDPEEAEEAEAQAAAWGRLTSLTCLQVSPPAYMLYGAANAPALARLEVDGMTSSPEGLHEMLGDILGLSALRELAFTPDEDDVEGEARPCVSPDAARCLLACPCLEYVGKLCACAEGGARAVAAEALARAPRPLVLDFSSDSEGEA